MSDHVSSVQNLQRLPPLVKEKGHTMVYKALYDPVPLALFFYSPYSLQGLPGSISGEEPVCQCRRHEMRVQSLGWENPLEEEMATPSILALGIPWTGGCQAKGQT